MQLRERRNAVYGTANTVGRSGTVFNRRVKFDVRPAAVVVSRAEESSGPFLHEGYVGGKLACGLTTLQVGEAENEGNGPGVGCIVQGAG